MIFRIKGSYNSDYTQQKARTTSGGISYKATIAKGEYEEDGAPKVVYVRQGDSWPLGYEEKKWGGRNWYAEASLNYTRKFGDHNFGALVLYNESKNYYPGGVYNSIPRGYVGMVGRVTYDYQTKYMIDLNMGYNGSENFAKGKRFGFFPSASLGWIISSEKFWEPIRKVVSYLKLRGSIGKVGNDQGVGRFLYLPGTWQFIHQQRWSHGGPTTVQVTSVPTTVCSCPVHANPATVTPMLLGKQPPSRTNGADVHFFWRSLESRVSTSSGKTARTSSFPTKQPSRVFPLSSPIPSTFGRVKNHGYEMTLRWADKIGKVDYSIAPTFAFARNKVVEMAEVKKEFPHMYRTGHPVGQPFRLRLL